MTSSGENSNNKREIDGKSEDCTRGKKFAKYTEDTRISVDVRGRIFKVDRDTLNKMASFREIIESDENISNIYLDRSPNTFEDILNFLKYGVFPGQSTGKDILHLVKSIETIMFIKDSGLYGVSGVADIYVNSVFPPERHVQKVPHSQNLMNPDHWLVWKAAACDLGSNPTFCERLISRIGTIPDDAWDITGDASTCDEDIELGLFISHAMEHGNVCTNDIMKLKGAQISYCACLNGKEFLVMKGKTICPTCVHRM